MMVSICLFTFRIFVIWAVVYFLVSPLVILFHSPFVFFSIVEHIYSYLFLLITQVPNQLMIYGVVSYPSMSRRPNMFLLLSP